MPNRARLLRRGPRIDEVEVEAARSITLARLSAIFDDGTATVEDAAPAESVAPAEDAAPAESVAPAEDAAPAESVAPAEDAAPAESVASVDDVVADMTARAEAPAVPTDDFAAHDSAGIEPGVHRNGDGPLETIAAMTAMVVMADRGSISTDPDGLDHPAADVRDAASPLPSEASMVRDKPSGARRASPPKRPPRVARPEASSPRPAVRPQPGSRPRPVAPSRPSAKSTDVPVAVIASCPYCALLLEPPPEADRRCARCRQRIIVKRVRGRAVYLTEAAVQVFEAERQRIANTGRWTRDRERWLKLAASVRAPAGRIARLKGAVLSDEVVADARALYETTVERLVRTAKRDHNWDDAARLRRDEALSLYRIAGSPVPPPDDIAALHREGALASLHALGEIAKEAELIGAGCCDSCRADDGRHFRISRELREPRLPHAGCSKGLCRCRWELTARDRTLVGRYLRRHARPDRVAPSA